MKRWKPGPSFLALTIALIGSSVFAQGSQVEKINSFWDNLDKKYPNLNKKYETKELQKAGTFQKAGEIAIPRGIKAISRKAAPCSQHFVVGADTLFEFDKSTLTPFAMETLKELAPMISKLGSHPIKVEGHTDGKGTDEYNQSLSEKRAERVKNWLLENRIATILAVSTEGFGKKHPVAPNTKPDGSDNPQGRALNRRVEIIVDTCKDVSNPASQPTPMSVAAGSAYDTVAGGSGTASSSSASSGMDSSLASAGIGGSNSDAGMNISGSVDNSKWLPYVDVVSADELKKDYTNLKVTPLNNNSLYFEITVPNEWSSKPVEVPPEVLKNDSTAQVPLAQLEPKDGNAIIEVRYLRVPEEVPLSRFIQKYSDASGFKLVTRQHGQFNQREVEDALLQKQSEKFGTQLTRLTASRKGPLVIFVAASCPEKEYEQWKKIFAAAALTFNPIGK